MRSGKGTFVAASEKNRSLSISMKCSGYQLGDREKFFKIEDEPLVPMVIYYFQADIVGGYFERTYVQPFLIQAKFFQ